MEIEYHLFEQDFTENKDWVFCGSFDSEQDMFQLMEREKKDRKELGLRPRNYKFETIYN